MSRIFHSDKEEMAEITMPVGAQGPQGAVGRRFLALLPLVLAFLTSFIWYQQLWSGLSLAKVQF